MILKLNDSRCLVKNRFDIKIKVLYALELETNSKYDFYKKIYKNHLMLWNGFKERYPRKEKFEHFDISFKNTLNDIKTNGFSPEISTVPVDMNFYPTNGAHRIAACILYKKPIYINMVFDRSNVFFDERYFLIKGVSKDIIDKVNLSYKYFIDGHYKTFKHK